ncbi:MAG: gluconolaconase, partial [Sphingomonas sp.]
MPMTALRATIATALLASVSTAALAAPSASVFTSAPADPRAVTVVAKGDGVTDDGAAIQRAIDAAAAQGGAGGGGIVFLPAGRYRLTRTLYMWPGVRLFGVGRTRPVFVLAAATPGFQRGVGSMVFFTGNRPGANGADRGPVPVPVPPIRTVRARPVA